MVKAGSNGNHFPYVREEDRGGRQALFNQCNHISADFKHEKARKMKMSSWEKKPDIGWVVSGNVSQSIPHLAAQQSNRGCQRRTISMCAPLWFFKKKTGRAWVIIQPVENSPMISTCSNTPHYLMHEKEPTDTMKLLEQAQFSSFLVANRGKLCRKWAYDCRMKSSSCNDVPT